MNDPKILALGTKVLQSDINSPEAKAAGISLPYPGFTGIVAQALRPYPQYQAIEWRDVPVGKSRYDSFQINLDKRFSNGLQFRTFYVHARLLNNRAESGQRGGGAVQNPINANAENNGLCAITNADPSVKTMQNCLLRGTPGTYSRLSSELSWRRTIVDSWPNHDRCGRGGGGVSLAAFRIRAACSAGPLTYFA